MNDHTETYEGCIIYPVATTGLFNLYERPHYRRHGLKKYVIFGKDDKARTECRTRQQADRWIRKNTH